jgi:hypothetical protein
MTAWQPATWVLMHTLTNQYNDEFRDEYINFFESLKVIIPCGMCRDHYNGNIANPKFGIGENVNSERIFNWTVDLHNLVNIKTGKKVWSYTEAREYYTQNRFNDGLMRFFMLQYIKTNFRRGFQKNENLFKMLRSLPYLHPDEDKRKQLIDFKNRFELNKDTVRNWLIAFLVILKGK